MSIEMQSVTSSNIESVGYDKAESVLRIRFHNGGTYDYFDVPESVFADLVVADSTGKFFERVIRNAFSATKVA